MKPILTIVFLLLFSPLIAQVDTVVVRADSMFESKMHRKLNNKRTNVKYHLDERGTIRDMIVYLATLEELNTGYKQYAVRVDNRLNRNLFTDAPVTNAEYIDEDELPLFISYLEKITREIMPSNHGDQRYTEYRFYTRAGIMLECYTGVNRWRCAINYELGTVPINTYINNPEALDALMQTFISIQQEIAAKRKTN